MNTKTGLHVLLFSAAALLFTACKKLPDCKDEAPKISVFASGLNNPRGLKFGPDGYLYVAEGGLGGSDSTVGQCDQVPFPIGPYLGSPTGGRVSKIDASGVRYTVTDQLPSSQDNEIIGSNVQGVADVAFLGNTLYAVLSGAGCSHGVPNVPNGVVKIEWDGSWSLTANISDYVKTHPVQNPEEEDFEPDGSPYSLVSVAGDLYVLEANHGELMRVTTGGSISRVLDISASQGHIVPTAMVYHDGNFYVGNLHPFPIVDGSSNIYRITPAGDIQVWATGFTTVLGLAFDKQNQLYVLENTTGAANPTPGTGRVVRINGSGDKEVIASGLSLPTGMTLGPDGNLYVSNWGFGPTAKGGGQVLQITLNHCSCDGVEDVKN